MADQRGPVSWERCQEELQRLAVDGFDLSTQLGDVLAEAAVLRKDHKDMMAGALLAADGGSEDRRRAQATRRQDVRVAGDRLAELDGLAAKLRVQLDDVYRRVDVWRTLASTARRLLPE